MILTVGNVKGGVGKTTLAVNLAIARARVGMDVLLIDGDNQATALDFTTLRTEQSQRNQPSRRNPSPRGLSKVGQQRARSWNHSKPNASPRMGGG